MSRPSLILIAGLLTAALLGACAPPTPWPSEAYVWQRRWTPELIAALEAQQPLLAGARVQAMSIPANGPARTFAVPLDALARLRLPVRAVIRIEGRRPLEDGAQWLSAPIALARQWRAAGIELRGIEIDYDCASARLSGYARWLVRLRGALPPEFALSITALPAWLESPDLDAVLAVADESVLQVHGVDDPHRALFDPARAQDWVLRWSARTSRPFRVSLPAYATRAVFDARGQLIAVESEAGGVIAGDARRELFADPLVVQDTLRWLDRERPAHLQGLLWFRLPAPGDRRAWSAATFAAVLARAAAAPTFVVRWQDGRDLRLHNLGPIDAQSPRRIGVRGACVAGDGVNGYRWSGAGYTTLVADTDNWLRAGQARTIGWLRCEHPDEVIFDVQP